MFKLPNSSYFSSYSDSSYLLGRSPDLLTYMQLIMNFIPKRKDRRETRELWISDLAHVCPAGPRARIEHS